MSLFTETVVPLKRTVTGEDEYGNDITEMVPQDSQPAWLEQVNSTETVAQNEQTTARMVLYLPLGVDVAFFDGIRWGGFDWSISGEPGRQPGGFVVEGYQVVALTRTKG